MLHAFTSAAVNYLPKCRLLCESVKRHHPEIRFHLALTDQLPVSFNPSAEPFDSIITIGQLEIPDTVRWLFKHNLTELSTAIKPFVMKILFRQPGCDGILYFDPDIVVFSKLDDLLNEFASSSIALTPHLLKPSPTYVSVIDHEIFSTLRNGLFNLGFAAVKNDANGRAFADWWADRLYHFCRAEPENGMWTDQKWADLAPIYFAGVHVLRSPRFNVASWNLPTRHLTGTVESGFYVEGLPLGFYHFTGWDSGAHLAQVLKHAGSSRDAALTLLQWYESQVREKSDHLTKIKWAYDSFDNGMPITALHRRLYRERSDLQNAFPNPFNTGNGFNYHAWFERHAPLEHPDLFDGVNGEWKFDVR
ncbi:hypothetical protein KIH86_06110 [Paenibacillus sp. HN-1]|uniref:glycosyltransferase n=1 Tax=Paenibacillus TaxID=44249 RepID=UPI001CAA3DD2|nr:MULTISPECIES: glycosyltransferase [Paenibacillus]MBY9078069.1 hypothetical protein [Paenibacillus sp. CGMCC 1.18879]MBY9083810.1 hypothetical protein [Paenibacillus sinensis]